MATKNQSTRIGHGHTAMLREIAGWLDGVGNGTPLEIGVVEDLIERVEHYTKTAAVVRIRALNAGTPPSERARRAARASGLRQRDADTRSLPGDIWEERDLDRLRALVRADHTDAEIADLLGRTEDAVESKRQKLAIKQRDHRHQFTDEERARALRSLGGRQIRPETAYQRAQRVIRERRRREMGATA